MSEYMYGTISIGELPSLMQEYEIEVESPEGWIPVLEFINIGRKPCYRITTYKGFTLECADTHLIQIYFEGDSKNHPKQPPYFIPAKDAFVGLSVITKGGKDQIKSIDKIGVKQVVDISIDSENQIYFTEGISSHNSPGSGKTTTARVFAKAVVCDHEDREQRPCNECKSCKDFQNGSYSDYIEVDGASYNKVEDVKILTDIAKTYPVFASKSRIILIDEAHRLSNAAWDTMLKLLEDGVTKTIFLFATTELDKIRPAIQSRSIVFQVKPLSVSEISKELVRICKKEGIEFDLKSVEAIAYAYRGKTRDAIKTLDMYNRAYGKIENVSIKTPEEQALEMVRLSYFNNIKEAYDVLDNMITSETKFGGVLCSALSALYIYPKQITTGIPDSILKTAKNLMSKDIKKMIELYSEYKPDKYEEVKLFLLLISELGASLGGNAEAPKKENTLGSRTLFKKEQKKPEEVVAEFDESEFDEL